MECCFAGVSIASHYQYPWPINSNKGTYGDNNKTMSFTISQGCKGNTIIASVTTSHPDQLEEEKPERVFRIMDKDKKIWFKDVVKEVMIDERVEVEVVVLGLDIGQEYQNSDDSDNNENRGRGGLQALLRALN